jgi:hypothetical protein
MRALLFALLFCCVQHAAAVTLTDTWSDPANPGSGISVVHDGDRLTIGLFVHDAAGEPRWYTAALQKIAGSARERPEFSGTLYETRRVPGARVSAPVGPIVFRARSDGKAILEYSLGAAGHAMQVERFGFTADRLEGLFFATLLPGYDSCEAGFEALNVFVSGVLRVERCDGTDCFDETPDPSRDRSPFHLQMHNGLQEICRIDGVFARHGVSGAVEGRYECSDGGEGDIVMEDVEFTSVGFNARFSAGHPRCGEFYGILSGVRANAR